MAQVKKLQNGGSPSNKYLMFNGTKIVEGDDNFKQLEQQALNGNRAAQSMLKTLRSSSYDNSMVVNTTDNGVDFQNVDMGYYNDRTGKQFEKGDNWWRRNVSRTKEGKDYIKDFIELKFSTPSNNSKETKSDLDKLTKASRVFAYKNGEYDAYNVDNAAHEKAVRDIARYFSYGNKDEAAKYFDVSDLGNVDALWTIYNNAKESGQNIDFEKFIRDVRSERRSNEWDDPTFRILQNFGFMGYDPTSSEEVAIINNNKLKELGFDPEKAKGVLIFDKDGNLVLDQNFLNSFSEEFENKNGNYWFNDQFANMLVNGESNPYAWLNGWTAIGNKLYKSDDQKVKDFILNSGFADKNKQSLYNDANDIMQSLWGNQIQFDKYSPDNFHSNWAKDKQGLRYRGISGYDIGKDELGRSNQLVEYYDDSDTRDSYGYINVPRYAILNGNGDFVKDVNINDLVLSADAPGSAEVVMNEILDASQGKHFAGKYQELFQGNNGLSDLKVFTDPNTGRIIIQDSDLKGDQRGKAIILPKELAKTIKGSKWFEYISKNKGAKERFYKSLQQLTSSAMGDFLTSGNISDWWFGRRKNDLKIDFINAGYSQQEAEEFANMMEKWTRNTRSAFKSINGRPNQSTRESYVLREPLKSDKYKDGGKIEKHAIGDLIGESKGTKGIIKVNKIQGNQESLKQAWGIGSKDSKEFSDADWMDLGAMIADLGALGVTLVDPTNIGGAIAGLAGSTATFAADVKRDGFQLGDLGSYGLNLVMDAATLLPILGDAASGAKAVKTLKKAAPLLSKAIKAGAIVGVGDAAINTIDKIAKGESFTISDARRLINGLSSGITLKRTGLLTPKTKQITTPEFKVSAKNKDVADFKFTTDEIKQIRDTPKDEQLGKIIKIISDRTGKTANEVAELFDIDAVSKVIKRPQWKFWKGLEEQSRVNIPTSKTKRRLMTDAEIRAKAKDRNGFQNWFFGTGNQQRLYNSWLRNFVNPLRNTITIKGSTAVEGYWESSLRPAFFTNGTTPGLVPLRAQAQWIPAQPGVPDKTIVSKHASRLFTLPPVSSIIPWWQVSSNEIPEEHYYPGTEPVYEFKQGGVIKAQKGISALYSWTPKATNTWTSKDGYMPTKLNLNTSVIPESKTAFKHTPSKQLVYDFKTQSDAIANNAAQKLSTIGIIPQTTNGGLDSGNGTIGKNINWNSVASNALEAGNFIRAWNEGNRIKRIYNKKSQALANTQMYHMPEVGLRFQNPIHSQYDKQIADLYHRTGMQAGNTSDAKLQTAIFSDANNLAMNHRAQQNLVMSDAWTNYQNQNLQNKQRYDQINWEIDAQNKQKQYAATDLRLTGEADVNTQRSQLLDKAFNKAQYLVDKDRKVNAAMAEFMLKYPNATLDQQDQYKTYVQAQYAKKGGKLRPMTEQMLLNNQKIVAKAIEKMNDNTMKLILKALS